MNRLSYDLITFDVYSALFDLESSLQPRLVPQVEEGKARDLLQEWRRLQLEYTLMSTLLARGHVPFRTITRRALDVALHRLGMELNETEKDTLTTAWNDLVPWPDVPAALSAIRGLGYRMAILSNGDVDMLAAIARRTGVTFDHIFSAQEAGVYKPHPDIYHLPTNRLNIPPARILHVAGSARDVMGAKGAGLTCFWVNRRGDRVLDLQLDADAKSDTLEGLVLYLSRG